jgi:hypothetical protein
MLTFFYSTFRRKIPFTLALVLMCGLIAGSLSAQTSGKQRHVSLMLLNLSDNGAPERRLIQLAQEYGMNTVYLTIQWEKVYPDSPTRADWARFDEQIKSVVDRGMSVAIRISLTRGKSKLNGYWDWDKDGLKDQYKISQMGGYSVTTFRYNHQPSVDKAAAFVKEVVQRYKWVHDQGKLVFIATCNTPEQEAGYPYNNFEPDTDHPKIYPAIYDCSDQTVAEYREWLKGHYKKVERLNYAWGSNLKSFDEADPYVVHWEPMESFVQRFGKDWYRFRHEQLKKYTDQLIAAVKSVSPTIRYVSDYGSVMDEASGLRGTIAFPHLNQNADGVKVNDSPGWDHKFSMDVIRGGMPKGSFIANEVFIGHDADITLVNNQVNQCFEHGADLVCFVISTEASMQRVQGPIREAVARWKSNPKFDIVDSGSLSYSLIRAIDQRGIFRLIYAGYRQASNNGAKPIQVKMDDDMFVPSYWAMAANRLPYVRTPLPMQIKAIGKPFSFTVSKENFGDLDGKIESVQITNLPAWLKFDGTTVTGTASALGDTRLEVKAMDDEGGTVSAFLTLRIDANENANIPPTLQLNLSELIARVNEPYSYELPAQLFKDEDGTIARVEVYELPAWLRFSNGVLSGRPTVLGDYKVLLKAYDNQSAFVETFLTIRVMDQTFFNNAPRIVNAIPTQYSPENELFSLEIPTNTFLDPDGYVTSILLHSNPTWLSLTFNTIQGMPPGKGEYSFFVRAFDNNGSFVDAPVTLYVEEAALRFTLQEGGTTTDPARLGKIERGKIFQLDSLPEQLNILAEGNYPFDRVAFQLRGPFSYDSKTRRNPYTLYAGKGGFKPSIGRYDLYGEAYTWEDSLLYVTATHFYISRGDGTDLTGDMPVWTTYPNPFSDIVNVKVESEQPTDFFLVTTAGRRVPVPEKFIVRTGSLCQINLTYMGIPGGIYFLQASKEGVIRKTLKVVKK